MAEVKLRCGVYREGSVFSVNITLNADVEALQEAIFEKKRYRERHKFDASDLTLYLARKTEGGEIKWLKDDDNLDDLLQGDVDKQFRKMRPSWKLMKAELLGPAFTPEEEDIHVLVKLLDAVVPAPPIEATPSWQINKVWYGIRGTLGRLQGVNLSDARTLSRMALTNEIIQSVDEKHVLLVKSPPMTGKTSLAALVSRDLANRITDRQEQANRITDPKELANRITDPMELAKVFSFAALQLYGEETFLEAFKRQCGVDWKSTMELATHGYTIYLVVDEVQVLYKDPASSPRRKSAVFWEVVKGVRNDAASPIRILMFGAYGSVPQYTQTMTPVEFLGDMVLGIESLNFRPEEIEEYVTKWFVGVECLKLQRDMKIFCARLQWLTGGHVGLCTAAIDALNTAYHSWVGRGRVTPSADALARMLEQGSLYRDKDHALFDALISTRAVKVLETLDVEELDGLERVAYGVENQLDAQLADQYIRRGILIGCDGRVDFSSPVMWRYFVRMRIGNIERALHDPETLQVMIVRLAQAINYDSIRTTLGRTASTGIPLERAWQMEFYKAACRCTTVACETSADVGAVFGSKGFIDFTVECGGNFWGFELLREGSRLDEHIGQFAPGGSYSLLPLSDYCLVDFRRVTSMSDTTKAAITTDLNRCAKLYVVCYDPALAHVSVLNAQSVWNIF